MPPKKVADAPAPVAPAQLWSDKDLLEAYKTGLGPGILGKPLWQAAQDYAKRTVEGSLGPALMYSDPKEVEAHKARAQASEDARQAAKRAPKLPAA